LKVSRTLIIIAAVVIVAILAFGLVIGLGVIQGKSTTVTTTAIISQTFVETQTQLQPVTQTVLSTTSLPQGTSTITTTSTSVLLSSTTVIVPTTFNNTVTERSTILTTTTQNVSSSGVTVQNLLPSGSLLVFQNDQSSYFVPQGSIEVGWNGYFQITYTTTNSTAVQWVLQGNSINESSPSGQSGEIDFPVQAYIHYSLVVFNSNCTPYICGSAFNVTASISYVY